MYRSKIFFKLSYLNARLKLCACPLLLGSLSLVAFSTMLVSKSTLANTNQLTESSDHSLYAQQTSPNSSGYTWGVTPRNYGTPETAPSLSDPDYQPSLTEPDSESLINTGGDYQPSLTEPSFQSSPNSRDYQPSLTEPSSQPGVNNPAYRPIPKPPGLPDSGITQPTMGY